MRKLQFFSIFLISSVAPLGLGATLPLEIRNFLEKQKTFFETASEKLTLSQYGLLLERYADGLNNGSIFQNLKFDRLELLLYLQKSFPQKPVGAVPLSEIFTKKVKKLSKAFGEHMRGNIIDFRTTCDNQDYLLPFEIISPQTKDTSDFDMNPIQFELGLVGIGIPSKKNETPFEPSCLLLALDFSQKETHLFWLGTRQTACPIPEKKAGECLLRAAENLSRFFKLKSVWLQDESEIMCPTNRKMTSLTRLKIYLEGQGWYQKQGYYVKDQASQDAKVKIFRSYPLSAFLKEIRAFQPREDEKKLIVQINQYLEHFQKGHQSDNATTSEFLAWLWGENCSIYVKLDNFLFEAPKRFKFSLIYPETNILTKQLD